MIEDIKQMNKECLREWYLERVEECEARAAESKTFERREYYLGEVEYYKNKIEELED